MCVDIVNKTSLAIVFNYFQKHKLQSAKLPSVATYTIWNEITDLFLTGRHLDILKNKDPNFGFDRLKEGVAEMKLLNKNLEATRLRLKDM